ncbi:hypothetical protein BRADI_3g12853v3 [Brachypodium distachyon]|uniref:Uncharacterized protein n=1 Tax=Brachypodium distachyon TaxID=15368 RepID=A0A2K2CWR6_BRADI|nr:hypothetical protein BRADI_3g12853v3 [Brachypodium distachyon]
MVKKCIKLFIISLNRRQRIGSIGFMTGFVNQRCISLIEFDSYKIF